ncbi:MAG: radical SAM protein [Actinobacteria bacterium]|nr:radical SAM protein [Actinomycetota bacterium]
MYLHKDVSFKYYNGIPYIYQRNTDEIFEADEELINLLKEIFYKQETNFSISEDVLKYLVKEKLLTFSEGEKSKKISEGKFASSHHPPLQYLHLIITSRCNFRCKHCFVEQKPLDAKLEHLQKICKEFEDIGGLRLIVSGGEPLEHPDFFAFNEFLSKIDGVRRILLTNGWKLSLLSEQEIKNLNFDEVQISLDGNEEIHDWLRRKGSFKRVIESAKKIKNSHIDLSFATVIHSHNIGIFNEIENIVKEFQPFRWTIDFICATNKSRKHNLIPDFESANLLKHSFNSRYHSSSPGFACGPNLASILPDGNLCKCDYFTEISGGNAFEKGLLASWNDLKKIRIEEIDCKGCPFADSCRGGCRYRALSYNGNMAAKDPVACVIFNCYESS